MEHQTTPHNVEHEILTKGPPVFAKARRLSPEKLACAKAEFDYMMKKGICRPSNSPWASPLHLLCYYPIPHLQDFSMNLEETKIFSTIDLVRAFYHIPIRNEDIAKTAIVTPFGLFKFCKMTFGLKNAAQSFQRFMHQVLKRV